jgi:thiol-disulfide isomerase/thioredoxin
VNHFSNSPSFIEIDPLYRMLDSNLQRSLYGKYFYDEILMPAKNTEIGMIAPDFKFSDAKGDSVSLSSLKGKVVFLVFWASWNLPSIQLNEELKMLQSAYGENNFEVIQVSC